jgi:hypothetical protein
MVRLFDWFLYLCVCVVTALLNQFLSRLFRSFSDHDDVVLIV